MSLCSMFFSHSLDAFDSYRDETNYNFSNNLYLSFFLCQLKQENAKSIILKLCKCKFQYPDGEDPQSHLIKVVKMKISPTSLTRTVNFW